MLKSRVLTFYYNQLCSILEPQNFQDMISQIKVHFENEECSQMYLSDWQNTTLMKIITENPSKPKTECLELLFDKLMSIQQALPLIRSSEESLHIQILNACRGIQECTLCLYNPAPTLESI